MLPNPFTLIPVERAVLVLAMGWQNLKTHQHDILTHHLHREMVSYCMTKASALAFHEGLSAELRSESINAPEIKLTCVHPTWSSTAMIAPHRAKIDGSGMAVIEPYVVADAVVKQVLSGRGRQLILAPGVEFLSTMRSWPSWFVRGLNAISGT